MQENKLYTIYRKFGWLLAVVAIIMNLISYRLLPEKVAVQMDLFSGQLHNLVSKTIFLLLSPVTLGLIYAYFFYKKEKIVTIYVVSGLVLISNICIIAVNIGR